MAWHSPDSLATQLLGGPLGILASIIAVISLPILLHYFLYRNAARPPSSPVFLLLGPAGSGKTSLVTFMQQQSQAFTLEAATPPSTHTSQTKRLYPLILHPNIPLKSNRYRSDNDTSVINLATTGTPYKLLDTPGHGKLRSTVSLTTTSVEDPNLYGVIFMLDAAVLESSAYLTDVATYLHDTLLAMLKRRKSKTLKKDARTRNIPVLIAANKQDLFTALPAGSVREKLQAEIQRIRESRRRGVVGVDARDDDVGDEDEELLGGSGGSDEKFTFKALEDEEGADLRVEVLGGSVRGDEAGKGVKRWEEWIGQCL